MQGSVILAGGSEFRGSIANSTNISINLQNCGAAGINGNGASGLTALAGSGSLILGTVDKNANLSSQGSSMILVSAGQPYQTVSASSASQIILLSLQSTNVNVSSGSGSQLVLDVESAHNTVANADTGSLAVGRLTANSQKMVATGGSLAFGLDIDSENYSWTFGQHYTNTAGGLSVGYNGVTSLLVNSSGVRADLGFSSLATDAFLTFTSTGITNSLGKLANARFDGTAVTYVVKNNAGTPVYTNAVAVGHAFEELQAGGAIVITAGSGVTGTLAPK